MLCSAAYFTYFKSTASYHYRATNQCSRLKFKLKLNYSKVCASSQDFKTDIREESNLEA